VYSVNEMTNQMYVALASESRWQFKCFNNYR